MYLQRYAVSPFLHDVRYKHHGDHALLICMRAAAVPAGTSISAGFGKARGILPFGKSSSSAGAGEAAAVALGAESAFQSCGKLCCNRTASRLLQLLQQQQR
jgi:hypothetical protein